jgi:uncharacterized membrane protein
MDFIAFIVAIIAFVVALKSRSRIALLEHSLELITRRLEGGAAAQAAPQTPGAAAPAPRSPLEQFGPKPAEAPPVAPPPPRMDERDIEKIISDAAQPPSPPVAPDTPAEPPKSFEERFGASWVVWIGGLALALGGIFMVQYSIEAGLIGPGVRIFLGGLLATALIAAGEWTRRREIAGGVVYANNAHIPSILTAAGTTVAFATVYAAYALYEFLVPGTAFVLLGIVALATLAASLLHGPALAALGQVGAFVTPMLIATGQPNYWALYVYLAVVTAASFTLARTRMWLWLALTAVVFSLMWAFPGISDLRFAPTSVSLYLTVVFALAAALLVSGLLYGPESERGRIDAISSATIAAYLFAAATLVLARDHDGLTLIVFSALAIATVAIAWRTEAAAAALPVAGVLAALVIADWAVDIQWTSLVVGGGPAVAPDASRVLYGSHLALGGFFAALFGAAGFLAQGRSERQEAPILWAVTAVVTPLLILIALYVRIYGFERSIPFAALELLAAAIYGVATEMLTRREPRPGSDHAAAIFATGAIAALALAMTLALEKGWLTVALSLMVPGVALIERARPLPWLRVLAGVLVGVVMLRIGYEPRIGAEAGTTPIFNWILYGYGIPAIAFWFAASLLRKRADDAPARMVDAAAILFTVLCACLQIRHYLYGGDIYHANAGLTEVALQVSGGLALVIGLERLRLRTNSIVHDMGALVIAALCLIAIVLGLLLFENPWLNGTNVGGLIINLNLLGYLIPAILAAALGLITRETRPQRYRTVAAVTAVVLALTYLSLQVARVYQGPRLSIGPISGAEGYTYSAVWLAFGVLLLVIGFVLRSQPVRLCSAAVVLATVVKVFLLDMAGLTGLWRGLSFIGLGLVLMGIGYFYQRLLFPKRPPAALPPAQPPMTSETPA